MGKRKKAKSGDIQIKKNTVWMALVAIAVVLLGLAGWILTRSSGDTSGDYVPEVSGAPAIEVDETLIDYGDVKYNEPITTVFTVKNVGDKDLKITEQPQVQLLQGC